MHTSIPANGDAPIRIGDLAARTGVSVEALRYYERRGLVRPSGRRASGYREYPSDTVGLVRFIKRAQALGFTLGEVSELVRLRGRAWSGDTPWQLREAAVAKVDDIERRIRELGALRSALAELVHACDAHCAVEEGAAAATGTRTRMRLPCPLVEAFDTEEHTTPNVNQLTTRPSAQRRGTRARRT